MCTEILSDLWATNKNMNPLSSVGTPHYHYPYWNVAVSFQRLATHDRLTYTELIDLPRSVHIRKEIFCAKSKNCFTCVVVGNFVLVWNGYRFWHSLHNILLEFDWSLRSRLIATRPKSITTKSKRLQRTFSQVLSIDQAGFWCDLSTRD